MNTNDLEITIGAPIAKVWKAITNSKEIKNYLKNIHVESDWTKGAAITYTCYDEKGKVMKWEGMDMIWKGIIEVLNVEKEYTCIYPDKSSGLEKESYFLEAMDVNTTLVKIRQHTISQEIAEGYKEGTLHTLKLLKTYLEN
jgi:uncharacterized protein YndB with AHSA1/START domain